jgi:hypothetical protein
MDTTRKQDPDGVDRDNTDTELHENVRESTEGVERKGAPADKRRPAAGLIGGGATGVGEMTDPRYIAQR